MQTQESINSESEGATLERRARIELQRQTGELFPDDEQGIGPTLDTTDPNASVGMDVDDSATSAAPTEAANPGYAMNPPPTKVPRTGSASEARKFFTGSIMNSETSDLSESAYEERIPPPPKARPPPKASLLVQREGPHLRRLVRLSQPGRVRMWRKSSSSRGLPSQLAQRMPRLMRDARH